MAGLYSELPLFPLNYGILSSDKGIILTGNLIRPDMHLTVKAPHLWFLNLREKFKELEFQGETFQRETYEQLKLKEFLDNLAIRMETDLFNIFLKHLVNRKQIEDEDIKELLFKAFNQKK